MSICPKCGKKIRGADKIKVKGVWMHHHSSRVKKLIERSLSPKTESYSDDQLLRRAVEKSMGV